MIKWVLKAYEPDEIVLSLSVTDNGLFAVITFKHYSYSEITSTGYVDIGIEKDRMYFREGTDCTGYKLVGTVTGSRRVHTSKEKITDFIENRVGQYRLCKDESNGFFYIDTKKGD